MKRIRISQLVWLVILIAIAAGGYWLYQTQYPSASASSKSTSFTQITTVKQGSLSSTISVVGQLDAVQSETLAFSKMTGTTKLAKLNVAAGNSVKKGDVLATIDAASYQQALDQARSALLAAQKTLTDLTTPATKLQIATADVAVAQAQKTLEQSKQDLVDLKAPDLVALQNAIQDAQDTLTLLGFQEQLDARNSLAKSERDLKYNVDWYTRRVNELEAQKRKNLEEETELTNDKLKLAELQADLARVQAQRQLAAASRQAERTKDQVALADAQKALATAQAGGDPLALAKAQLAIQNAQVTLQTAQKTRADLDTGAAASDIAVAQAAVDEKQLAVTDAQAALNGAQLTASFDGTVLKTDVAVGDQVSSATTVLTVANLKGLQVAASVDETTIKRVAVGQNTSITFDAFPGQTLTGKVLDVPLQGTLQNSVMVYEVPVSLVGADKVALLVGMTANVKIQVASVQNALLVPTLALTKTNGQYAVLIPNAGDPNGTPTSVPVEVGLSDGTNTQITKGLNVGDKVVVQIAATTTTNNNRQGGGFSIFGFGR